MTVWALCIAAAYLVGSVPFGVIIGRVKGIDIRQYGSKNIGATNVSRVLGRRLGLLCFALDFLKGAVPVIAAGLLGNVFGHEANELSATQMLLWMATALATMLGHMFSPWLGFSGGKGVATGLGAMVAMYPLLTYPALGALVVWYVTLRLFKYVSLASIAAVVSLPVGVVLCSIPRDAQEHPVQHTIEHLLHAWPPLAGTILIASLVIYKHRANIGRLRRGEEPKAGHRETPIETSHSNRDEISRS